MSPKKIDDRFERYTHLMSWAWRRYQTPRGTVIISTGGHPSAYSRIEQAAWDRYISNPRDQNGRLIFGN
jgi:hypothetical protein